MEHTLFQKCYALFQKNILCMIIVEYGTTDRQYIRTCGAAPQVRTRSRKRSYRCFYGACSHFPLAGRLTEPKSSSVATFKQLTK